MKIDPTKHRCLLVETLKTPLYRGDFADNTFFRASVANFANDGNTPENWRLPFSFERIKNDTGGCQISAFVSKWRDEPATALVLTSGPSITSGQLDDYKHAANALRLIERRLESIYQTRGPVSGPAEEIARWIEATGVKMVFLRPEHATDNRWLNQGDWLRLSPGQFNSRMIAELAKINAAA